MSESATSTRAAVNGCMHAEITVIETRSDLERALLRVLLLPPPKRIPLLVIGDGLLAR